MSCVSDALRREAKIQRARADELRGTGIAPNQTMVHMQMWAMLERLAHDLDHPKQREPPPSHVES